jgi:hypothetical protein
VIQHFFFPECIQANALDSVEIGDAIRVKDETEKAGDEIVQFFALLEIREISAIRAGGMAAAHGAGLHFAVPVHRPFAVAALAFSLSIHAAVAATEPAISNDDRRLIHQGVTRPGCAR